MTISSEHNVCIHGNDLAEPCAECDQEWRAQFTKRFGDREAMNQWADSLAADQAQPSGGTVGLELNDQGVPQIAREGDSGELKAIKYIRRTLYNAIQAAAGERALSPRELDTAYKMACILQERIK